MRIVAARIPLALILVCTLAVAGCGSGGTSNGLSADTPNPSSVKVAVVAGKAISLATFDHWVTIINASDSAFTGRVAPPVPEPPRFSACVASARATAKRSRHLNDATLLKRCRQAYAELRDQTMGLLVRGAWIVDEASRRGVSLDAAALARALQSVKATEFPERGEFAAYLRRSRQSESDVLFRLRIDLLTARLRIAPAKLAGRWRPLTVCAPAYRVPALCGTGRA